MTCHNLSVPCTSQLKKYIETHFADEFECYPLPENIRMTWGIDHDGYFVQLYTVSPNDNDCYIENGLMGTNKNKVLDKLEKYGILEFIRKNEPDKFNLLVLDLPF